MNFENILDNRRVLVGVTASVSIYKSLELIRMFQKASATVRVVMSEEAKKFISPLMFESVTGYTALHLDSESWTNENNHIGFAKWGEVAVIAPATANTIAKLANAIADNLLLQTMLASKAPKVIAPAANTAMIEHPITKANLKMLSLCGYEIVEPCSKRLACGDVGNGALADVEDIFLASARELLKDDFWRYRNVVVTGGGSIERIDDVRYIGNFSSGKMADSLSVAAYILGADVTLISSKTQIKTTHIERIKFESQSELAEKLDKTIMSAKEPKRTKPTLIDQKQIEVLQKPPYLFMASAVADFVPTHKTDGKIKKEQIGDDFCIQTKKSGDILASIQKEGIKTVGFKAETDWESALQNATLAMQKKGIDAICLNVLGGDINFGSDENEVLFLADSFSRQIDRGDKLKVAFEILELAKKL